jgi:hypothetical protein
MSIQSQVPALRIENRLILGDYACKKRMLGVISQLRIDIREANALAKHL